MLLRTPRPACWRARVRFWRVLGGGNACDPLSRRDWGASEGSGAAAAAMLPPDAGDFNGVNGSAHDSSGGRGNRNRLGTAGSSCVAGGGMAPRLPAGVGSGGEVKGDGLVGGGKGGDEWGDLEDAMDAIALEGFGQLEGEGGGEGEDGGSGREAGQVAAVGAAPVEGLLKLVAAQRWEEAAAALPDLSFMTVRVLARTLNPEP